jgi:molybdenum cofactor synthesis domain-containing protein
MEARVLTIGTEITIGEIVNTNAAWISQQLEAQGYAVMEHLSVRDEESDILSALKRLQKSDLLIVCGGLGPTSDDMTREMMAKWAEKPLQFSEKVWRDLSESYKQRGLTLREAHKHQCWFPKGSKVLVNPVGTAHGFSMKKGSCEVFVLPGPPRELEGMWAAEVAPKLRAGGELPWTHWTVLGTPESEVAEAIEPLIEKLKLEVGYRASVPYVYVKLRGKKMTGELIAQVDEALKSGLVSKGKIDFAVELLDSLKGQDILFQDQVTGGILGTRLSALHRLVPETKIRVEQCFAGQPFSITTADNCAQLLRIADNPHAFDITWRNKRHMLKARMELPFKIRVDSERGARSATEWALYKLWQWSKE